MALGQIKITRVNEKKPYTNPYDLKIIYFIVIALAINRWPF